MGTMKNQAVLAQSGKSTRLSTGRSGVQVPYTAPSALSSVRREHNATDVGAGGSNPSGRTKTCSSCNETKPIDQYRRGQCRDCINVQRRDAYQYRSVEKEAERKRRSNKKLRDKKHQAWLDAGGIMIDCACGCGTPITNWDMDGTPFRYIKQHSWHDPKVMARFKAKVAATHVIRKEKQLDIETFRTACRTIKKQKGYTWQQMADIGGLSLEHLKSIMFRGPNQQYVKADWSTDFFRRHVGLPTEPSPYQVRMFTEQIDEEARVDGHMDAEFRPECSCNLPTCGICYRNARTKRASSAQRVRKHRAAKAAAKQALLTQ